MLTVRMARTDEVEQVMDFYTQMIDEMRGTDFDVLWEHGIHPSPAFLREAISAGQVYVGVLDEGAAGDASARGGQGAHEGANARGGDDAREGGDPGGGGASRIACALVMDEEGEAGYEDVPWSVPVQPGEAYVLHVVATLPVFHGRGYARQLVAASVEAARAAGKKAVRLDTFVTNARGRRLYESCGFDCLGTHVLRYGNLGPTAVALYEKAL